MQDFSKLTVLMVEDERHMSNLLNRTLYDLGVGEVLREPDGAKGIKTLFARKDDIDLLILDLEMPVLDGISVLKFLRNAEEFADNPLPVLVLTGHSDEKIVEEAAEIGVNAFMLKPISKASLVKNMIRAMTYLPTNE